MFQEYGHKLRPMLVLKIIHGLYQGTLHKRNTNFQAKEFLHDGNLSAEWFDHISENESLVTFDIYKCHPK
jgi:hypothetical protein